MQYRVAIQYTDTVNVLDAVYATYEEALATALRVQREFIPGDALTAFVIAGEPLAVTGSAWDMASA